MEKLEWVNPSKLSENEEMTIQPLQMEGKEKFRVWDKMAKQALNDGDEITTTKGVWKIDKYMKLKELTQDEQQRWRRWPCFLREVMHEGTKKMLSLSPSAERTLREKMEDCQNFGHDPKAFTYIISKKVGPNGIPQYYVRPGNLIDKETLDQQRLSLNDAEQKLVDAISADETARARPTEEKVELFIKNNVASKERAEEIVKSYF